MATLDEVLAKVRKLRRLSESSNPHEAALAAEMATRLLRQHQIDEAQIVADAGDDAPADEGPVIEETLDRGARKKVAWKGSLTNYVAKSLGCRMYWHGSWIKIIGRREDTQAVSYLVQYLCGEIDALADSAWRKTGFSVTMAKTWKNSFRMGAVKAIGERLSAMSKQEDTRRADEKRMLPEGAITALTVIERRTETIAAYYESIFPKSKKGWSTAATLYSDVYRQGHAAGQKIALDRGAPALGSGAQRIDQTSKK